MTRPAEYSFTAEHVVIQWPCRLSEINSHKGAAAWRSWKGLQMSNRLGMEHAPSSNTRKIQWTGVLGFPGLFPEADGPGGLHRQGRLYLNVRGSPWQNVTSRGSDKHIAFELRTFVNAFRILNPGLQILFLR